MVKHRIDRRRAVDAELTAAMSLLDQANREDNALPVSCLMTNIRAHIGKAWELLVEEAREARIYRGKILMLTSGIMTELKASEVAADRCLASSSRQVCLDHYQATIDHCVDADIAIFDRSEQGETT